MVGFCFFYYVELSFLVTFVIGRGALVAPGSVGAYRGSSRRGGRRGIVSDFPIGFFVGGSSIPFMNGLYENLEKDDKKVNIIYICF